MEFVRVKYMKGEKNGQLTGAVYGRSVPMYGGNQMHKEKLGEKLLCEVPRFNEELKKYTYKVYSPEQAIMLREQAKMVSALDEKAFNESAPTDEEIRAVFDFPEFKGVVIHKVPLNFYGKEAIGYAGNT